jgi:ribonuclease P protein component
MLLTFRKNEKLHHLHLIKRLFAEGQLLLIKPLKITWLLLDDSDENGVKLMISVPKALYKKAIHRNKIKRRLREAYRQNKNIIGDVLLPSGQSLVFCISYTSKEILSYSEIQDKIILLLRRLKEECGKII